MKRLFTSIRALVPVLLGVLSVASPLPARASTVAPLTPEQVVANADIIFQGMTLSVTPRWADAEHRNIVTDYLFRVERVLRDDKQALAARTDKGVVKLTFAGGVIGDRGVEVHGIPKFAAGERGFLFIRNEDLGAMAPTLGLWQGVYRVAPGPQGQEVITHASACCGAAAPVTSTFFSKAADQAAGFTAAQFAAEVQRAVLIAQTKPELALAMPADGPFAGFPIDKAARPQVDQAAGDPAQPAGAAEQSRSPAHPAGAPGRAGERPIPVAGPITIEGIQPGGEPVTRPFADRYSFTAAPPNVPYTFNIPPNMGAFSGQFESMLGYWNSYANDIFRLYANPTNTIQGGNSRNETGFLNGVAMDGQYHQGGWGATQYAVCYNYSQNNRIVESDICFNPGRTWTTDYTTGFNSGSTGNQIYFPPVALHEQGHAFGLAHQWVGNPGATFPAIMNYYTYDMEAEARFVYADDAAGIRAAYPTRIIAKSDIGVYLWRNTGVQAPASPGPPNNYANYSTFPSAVTAGNSFTLSNYTVENVGTVAVAPTIEFYLTPTRGAFTGQVYCGTQGFGTFGAPSSGRYSSPLAVPASTAAGDYYVAAYRQGGDQYTGNDAAWSNIRIHVNSAPPPPRPGNDLRANAYSVSVGTTTGTNVNATNDGGTSCGSAGSPVDVWYRVYAAYDGVIDVDTCGSSLDTVLGVWGPLGIFGFEGEQDCNDDAFLPCNIRASRLTFSMTAGSTRKLRVSGFNGATGTFALNVHFTAANNLCANATPVTTGTYYGYTTGSGAEGGETCGVAQSSPDIWYSYAAQCPGNVHLDTFGSAYDTVLSVRAGCAGPVIVCNDDCPGVGYSSCVNFFATPGTTYVFRLSGYAGASGAATLNVVAATVSPNDECASALAVSDGPTNVYTQCATDSQPPLPEGCGSAPADVVSSDVWFSYVPASDGTVDIAVCTAAYSPAVAVYDNVCPADPAETIACGAAEADCNTPLLSFTGLAGHAYAIRVGAAAYGAIGLGQGDAVMNITTTALPTGGCCASDGSCTISSQLACAGGGTYQGDSSACEADTCPVLVGACCAPDFTCTVSLEADCVGVFQGAATQCEAVVCQVVTGACCSGTSCTVDTPDNCAGASGSFKGADSACDFPGNPVTCCPANYNQAGGVTVQDIFDFLAGYFTQAPQADFNVSGAVTVQDIFDFLAAYFVGCP